MGLIGGSLFSILDALIAFAIVIVSPLVTDDIKAWLPRITDRLIERAVRRLPQERRDRYAEEWRSYVTDTPGDISKLIVAVGFLRASTAMASATRATANKVAVRPIERITALFLLIGIAPMFAVIAGLIKLDGGPALFRYKRVCTNGKVIKCWKFRTMTVPDAALQATPEVARNFLPHHNPHVTPFGRFLRRFSLDELPEMINVLMGEMHLIRDVIQKPFPPVVKLTRNPDAGAGEKKIPPTPTE